MILNPCLVNNLTDTFLVLDLIKSHNSNNLLKTTNRFEADFMGKVLLVVWALLESLHL